MTIRRALALALLVAVPACSTWTPSVAPVSEIVPTRELPRIQVVIDGRERSLDFPRIVGDSLVGNWRRPGQPDVERVAFGLDEVDAVRIDCFDRGRTATAMILGLGAWFALVGGL